jgi:Flp pilus assembly protein TadD
MKQILIIIIGLTMCLSIFGQSVDEQLKKSEELYESGKYQDAIRELTQLLVIDKKNSDAFLLRAICYSASGNLKLAGEDYNKAIELNPDTARYYYNRGVYFDYQGKTSKALKDYNKAIELDPKESSFYYNRAIIYDTQKDYNKSIQDYTNAINLDPKNPDLYNNRGLSYKNSGQFDKAIADYNKSLEINPEYSMGYYNRARVKANNGDNAGACDDFKKAADLGNKGAKEKYDQNCLNLENNITEYIKKETIGGELDFNKKLEKKQQGLFLYDGVAYNKKDFAFYLWGKKVKLLGLKTTEEAVKIYEELANRKLTDPEKKALINGFKSEKK